MNDNDLIDNALERAKEYASDTNMHGSGLTIERINAAIDANDITKSLYWQMLMELEGHMRDDDVLGKILVESAFAHWNRLNPEKKPMKARWKKQLTSKNRR